MSEQTPWDGEAYQARFDALDASGADVHGEADLVASLAPATVLDAGCGTGRVATELARRGIETVGVDADPSMVATARARAPHLEWRVGDLTDLAGPDGPDLGRTFDVVVMAGNVPLFTRPGTQAALVAGCARHVAPGGSLVAGFSLDRGYGLEDYDAHCEAAGLVLEDRWATWGREPLGPDPTYAVSVHRRPLT
jgi:SAM-dependent methyltransferase